MTGKPWTPPTPPPVAERERDWRGDVRFYAGDDVSSRCRVGPCARLRAHDGLCFFHLSYAEHVSDYMGPVHDAGAPEEGCEFCPAPGRRVSRLQGRRLAELAALVEGWLDDCGVPPSAAALAATEEFLAAAGNDGLLMFVACGEDGSVTTESPTGVEPWRSLDAMADGSLVLFGPGLDDEPDGLVCASAAEAWAVWRTPAPQGPLLRQLDDDTGEGVPGSG